MTDPTRRALLIALAASGGALLGACASAPEPAGGRRYAESISSVLVSQDQQHMVVIGRRHHYVFDLPELLARALRSPAHTQLNAAFTPFHVDKQGQISGEVLLSVPPGAQPALQDAAAAIGLKSQADGSWQATVPLQGRRYASWTYKTPGETREKLDRAHTIEVTTDEGLNDAAVDAAVTPVRVAADGVQLIYYAALAPIIIPFVFVVKARDH
jgi:hypothetical protein